jgi:hypothetical protein
MAQNAPDTPLGSLKSPLTADWHLREVSPEAYSPGTCD